MTKELPPYLNLSLENIEGEEWRDIEDWEGYYQISNFGRVKSLERVVEVIGHPCFSEKKIKERIKKIGFTRHHYLSVELSNRNHRNAKYHRFTVSHLVANAFLKEKEQYDFIVTYKNNNQTDLRPENLNWDNGDVVSTNMLAQRKREETKTSKYNGVSCPFIMSIGINRKIIREKFDTELEAAKKYDFYVKKNKLNRGLNFPDE